MHTRFQSYHGIAGHVVCAPVPVLDKVSERVCLHVKQTQNRCPHDANSLVVELVFNNRKLCFHIFVPYATG